MPNNTWNPNDKSANVILSGGDLVATNSSGAHGVRAKAPGAAKFYFEVTLTGGTGLVAGIGIATSAAVLTTVYSTVALAAYSATQTGNIYFNSGTVQATIGAYAVNDVICVATDTVNQRVWFRRNAGNWNNSGTANPATNVGGIDISSVFSAAVAYPLLCFASASVVTISTGNFGATSFAQAVPSGFSDASLSGLPSPPPGTTDYGGYAGSTDRQARDLRDYAQRLRARARARARQKEQEEA